MNQVSIRKMLLIFCGLWLGMTFAVDFVAIPQAFRNIPDAEVAGNLGVKVFSIFNSVEIFFGVLVLISSFFLKFEKFIFKRIHILIALLLLLLAITYSVYLSPGIERVLPLLHSNVSDELLKTYEAQHDFYHRLYLRLDSCKILLLMVSMGFMFMKGDKE